MRDEARMSDLAENQFLVAGAAAGAKAAGAEQSRKDAANLVNGLLRAIPKRDRTLIVLVDCIKGNRRPFPEL
jgi:hypothetical protein